jgi:putative tricarboxylic transport membrane protein
VTLPGAPAEPRDEAAGAWVGPAPQRAPSDPPEDPPADPPADPAEVLTAPAGPGRRTEVIAGVVLVAVGLALFVPALAAGLDRGITLGGPTTTPIVVTALWVVVATVYLVGRIRAAAQDRTSRATRTEPEGPAAPGIRWRVPLLLMVLLVAYAVVLKYTVVGYVLATALFFVGSARLLEHRPLRESIVRDVVVGVVLSLAIYLAFTRLLGISLPAGVLPL